MWKMQWPILGSYEGVMWVNWKGKKENVDESGEEVIIWPLTPDPEPANGKINKRFG